MLDPPNVTPALHSRSPDAKRQARKRKREKNGVSFYRLEISDRAIEGLIRQWIACGQISDEQAFASTVSASSASFNAGLRRKAEPGRGDPFDLLIDVGSCPVWRESGHDRQRPRLLQRT